MEARGDGRDAGHRRVAPPGTEIVIPGRTDGPVAFDHEKLPATPEHLKEEGKFYWFQVFDNNAHLHPEIDWPEVAILAEQYDLIAEFRAILKTEPVTMLVRNQMQAHPLFAEIKNCEMLILKVRDRLALNPIARSRINLAEVTTAGKLNDLQTRAEERKAQWAIIQRDDSGNAVGSVPVEGDDEDIVDGEFDDE